MADMNDPTTLEEMQLQRDRLVEGFSDIFAHAPLADMDPVNKDILAKQCSRMALATAIDMVHSLYNLFMEAQVKLIEQDRLDEAVVRDPFVTALNDTALTYSQVLDAWDNMPTAPLLASWRALDLERREYRQQVFEDAQKVHAQARARREAEEIISAFISNALRNMPSSHNHPRNDANSYCTPDCPANKQYKRPGNMIELFCGNEAPHAAHDNRDDEGVLIDWCRGVSEYKEPVDPFEPQPAPDYDDLTVKGHTDRVTGRPASVFTPPEDLMRDASDLETGIGDE